MINVAVLSDIHGYIDCYKEVYPDVELALVAGDLCGFSNIEDQRSELPDIIAKLNKIFPECHEIIIVPGNHDFLLERLWVEHEQSPGIFREVLGSDPGLHRRKDILRIPANIDILVTHEAPRYYKLKCVLEYVGRYETSEPGSQELYDRVVKVRPRYHFFGHIHCPCEYTEDHIKYFNVSQMDGETWVGQIRFLEI